MNINEETIFGSLTKMTKNEKDASGHFFVFPTSLIERAHELNREGLTVAWEPEVLMVCRPKQNAGA